MSSSFPVPCKGCFSLCSTKCFIYLVKFNSHDTHERSKLLNSDWDDPDQTHFKSKDILKGHTRLNLVLNTIQRLCFSCNLCGLFSVFFCPRLINASTLIVCFRQQNKCKDHVNHSSLGEPHAIAPTS